MNDSIQFSFLILLLASLVVLLLDALGIKNFRDVQDEKPHIRLFANSALIICMLITLSSIGSWQKILIVNNIHKLLFTFFLILNSFIALNMSHTNKLAKQSDDIFFLILSSTSLAISHIYFDHIVIKMTTISAWFILMATISIKSTEAGRKAEIGLKLCMIALLIFLLFLFSWLFNQAELLSPENLGIFPLALAALAIAGIPPFHIAHVDCASGANPKTAFLLLANSSILSTSLFLKLKQSSNLVALVLVFGLLILALRALDQTRIRRCLTYLALGTSPLFSLVLVFGSSALIPRNAFMIVIFVFLTLTLYILFSAISFLEPELSALATWEDISGLGRKYKLMTFFLLIALATMAGVPGTLGYFAKLSMVNPSLDNPLLTLSLIFSIALCAASLMRIFVFFYAKETLSASRASSPKISPYLWAAVIVVSTLGFFPFIH
jgi:NADH:ubiquinone oxidoreductase subunit 2 (subunit N)